MRKFIHKVQDLTKKAAEISQTMQGLPGKAAELREAVVMSAGELQQIRTDVQSNLNGLRANNEDRLLQAMREINNNTLVFEDAGYELTGMDLDLALAQRLSVQLRKFEDVDHSTLRSLLAQQTQETTRSVLSGILKAEETAANIDLSHLKLDGIVIHVGAIPVIRMCWRTETFKDETIVLQATATSPSPTSMPTNASNTVSSPAFGSFFEQRTVLPPAAPAVPAPLASPEFTIQPPTTKPSTSSAKVATGGNPLDRFKKMPDLTKKS